MGLLDGAAAKARMRQKQALLGEAAAAGGTVLQLFETGDEAAARAAAVPGALKALFGGTVRSDFTQILLVETRGLRHAYVQPYSGMSPIPGEHHAVLPGSVPVPIAYAITGMFGSPRWEAGEMKELAAWLQAHAGLEAVTDALAWKWEQGFTKIELDWTVQVRPLGDGYSHVAMQAGRYGGFTTFEVGFARFLDLCARLAPEIPSVPAGRQPFRRPVTFEAVLPLLRDALEEAAGSGAEEGEATPAAAAPSAPAFDYAALVRAVLGPKQGKKVHVEAIPEKKERNAREHVLPPAARGEKMVALLDLTTFGSAKDAIVITATHFYAKEIDDIVSFALSDLVRVVRPPGLGHTWVEVEVRGLGELRVPHGFVDEEVTELLQRLAARA